MIGRVCRLYRFAEAKYLTSQAYLKIRNSQIYELIIPTPRQSSVKIQIPRAGSLKDLTNKLKQSIKMENIHYICNQKAQLPESTPVDALITRYFYIYSDQYRMFPVEGQLFDYGKSDEVVQGIVGLELPAVTKRQVENYITRINQWFMYYTGKTITDQTALLEAKTVGRIFVQSAIDSQPNERRILQLQQEWQKLYWYATDLRIKKKNADQICLKKVRQKMSWGLMFLGANITFIWSGTYIFYSWDIIQPLAYFVSSLGAITLAAQFFKLGRPYSNYAYQQYLTQKLSPEVYKQVGFDIQNLKKVENQLIQLQSSLKDYYLKRL